MNSMIQSKPTKLVQVLNFFNVHTSYQVQTQIDLGINVTSFKKA